MTEATIVAKIKQGLRRIIPQAVTFKIQDYNTAGIPDLAINFGGRTTWVEVKLLRPDEPPSKLKQHFDQLQLASNILLRRQGRMSYLVAYTYEKKLRASLMSPGNIKTFLEGNAVDVGHLMHLASYDGTIDTAIEELGWRIKANAVGV